MKLLKNFRTLNQKNVKKFFDLNRILRVKNNIDSRIDRIDFPVGLSAFVHCYCLFGWVGFVVVGV